MLLMSTLITVHAALAVAALAKLLGRSWAVLMAAVALSSFWISTSSAEDFAPAFVLIWQILTKNQ